MENIKLQLQTSKIGTSESLKDLIISMVKAMQSDYGRAYQSQFSDKEVLRNFKNRLLEKLKGYNHGDIVRGYENASKNSPKFCPTVNEILSAIEEVDKEHKKAEINRIEAERVSALPPPTITCDPVKMFVEAKANQSGIPTRAEMEARIENHRALLIIHSDKIRSIRPNGDQLCKYGACNNAGTLSRSTKGDGDFYCADHFRQFELVKDLAKHTKNDIFTSKSGAMRNNEKQAELFKGCAFCAI